MTTPAALARDNIRAMAFQIRSLPAILKALQRGKVTPQKALLHPHKAPDEVKRIYKHVHEKSRRYELNLYVVGKEEDDAPPEGVAVGLEATPAHSSSAGHTPAERSPNR